MCDHKLVFDEDIRSKVCVKCTVVFPRKGIDVDYECDGCGRIHVYNPKNLSFQRSGEFSNVMPADKKLKNVERCLNPTEKVVIENMSARDVGKIARKMWVKKTTKMSKKDRCKKANIVVKEKPPTITLTNTKTGEITKFVTVYAVSKELGVSRSTITYHLKKTGKIKVGETSYEIKPIT